MPKLKNGMVVAYKLDNSESFGLIQIISKGKIGYNVRVFEKTYSDLSPTSIDNIVSKDKFYYIKEFYENDVFYHAGLQLGIYTIPSFVHMPTLYRSTERKLNGKLYWYVFDNNKGKIIQTFTEFDESLAELSPDPIWGIDYIKLRWMEGFSLENWHIFEEKWYQNYLLREKKDKDKNRKQDELPTFRWKKSKMMNSVAIESIEKVLIDFQGNINKSNNIEVDLILKKTIKELNVINRKYDCIETEESIEIIEFLSKSLCKAGFIDLLNEIDLLRRW